ncbi:saccharopine dehydrogenase family protein [Adhaeretor mobilis]|uniref:Lysine 6-dehydrogenase n=1 Tax=Adhaeretor mobilis TaxID=1930276 RepID=A0A517MSF4_9BACT|nr:saccharopine dehydrogenase C-terminal domain-containing protein [Adhaeretor mobilis]QDS97815.1 Lysine 6-dehydrogenase [Adhaeretor mobilis]
MSTAEKTKVAILGAGKIGGAVARILHHSGRYDVLVGDFSEDALERLSRDVEVKTAKVDVTDHDGVVKAISGCRAVLSACPFDQNEGIAAAALTAKVSYFDLTEDVATTKAVRGIAKQAVEGQIFMPQCGLAPGFIGILANDLCQGFEKLDRVKMRVGALPLYPTNLLKYNLTWSTDGLINEYCNLCDAIRNGEMVALQPMEGLEHFALDGVDYEAFNTSGGLGTLTETLAGSVNDLDYKTVRYIGHQYLMTFLLQGLRLDNRRDLLKELLEEAVPLTDQDVVLTFCTVTGWRDGRYEQVADARKIYHGELCGKPASSIQITTATSLCAVLDMHVNGQLPNKGFVRQEDVALSDFLANEFGKPYESATQVRAPIAAARKLAADLTTGLGTTT